MKIHRAYKTELDPTDVQCEALRRHAGTARFVYNWGLQQRRDAWKNERRSVSRGELDKQLRVLKKTDPKFGWLGDVSSRVPQEALFNLEDAFERFFERCKAKKQGKLPKSVKVGYPKPKTRRNGLGSFTISVGNFSLALCGPTKWIKLPKKLGKIRLKEHGYIPNRNITYLSATVSERAGRWFVSVTVEQEIPDPPPKPEAVVGVDLGIKVLATCSDGKVWEGPKPLERSLKKLRRLSRSLSKKQKGSRNRGKARHQLAKLHYRIFCQRQDTLHKITTELTKTKSKVVIEDLNVSGMAKNHKLARRVLDSGFYEFRRQLTYKGKWYGCKILVTDRFFPSSKRCSACHLVNDSLTLSDREWTCACGAHHDRDRNAAENLKQLVASPADSQNVCGEGTSAYLRKRVGK